MSHTQSSWDRGRSVTHLVEGLLALRRRGDAVPRADEVDIELAPMEVTLVAAAEVGRRAEVLGRRQVVRAIQLERLSRSNGVTWAVPWVAWAVPWVTWAPLIGFDGAVKPAATARVPPQRTRRRRSSCSSSSEMGGGCCRCGFSGTASSCGASSSDDASTGVSSCFAVPAVSSCAHEPRRKALVNHSPSHVHAQYAVRATCAGQHEQRVSISNDLVGVSAGSND